MKVKTLKKTPNELKVEVEGAGHTLCNFLQKRILEDEHVDLAGYDMPHPLASSSIIYIRTIGKVKPETVLFRAIEKARKMNKDFGEELKQAFKKT